MTDATTCAKCGASVAYQTFIDISSQLGYDCECGYSKWVHVDSCTCDECELARENEIDAEIDDFCSAIKDEWDETLDIERSSRSVYLTVYDDDEDIAATIRVSDHAPSVFRQTEYGFSDCLVIVGETDEQARSLTGRLTAYGAATWDEAVHVVSDLIATVRDGE